MLINEIHLNELNSPHQKINARVEIYKGSTLERTCTCDDALKDFTVERAGEGKFFGYGICHKSNANLIDINKEITITTEHTIKLAFGVNNNFIYPFPLFYVKNPLRDEATNELRVETYDALYEAENHTFEELELIAPYTIDDVLYACTALLGIEYRHDGYSSFSRVYENGANFDGQESLRTVLNRIAEATQTIYYLNNENHLVFKRLTNPVETDFTITARSFITLESGKEQILANVCHATALGDNVISTSEREGVIQYVRDNPFWDMREDIADLVNEAEATMGGLSIYDFSCEWIGNYLLEIGDSIAFQVADNDYFVSFLLDDVITYDGTLTESSAWTYSENDSETSSNPSSLGDALNTTFAKVDKLNKQITMAIGENQVNGSKIAQLQMTVDGLNSIVESHEESVQAQLDAANESIENLITRTNLMQTAEDVQIAIETERENGATKVKTSTGFTFDDTGLTVSKSDSEISTLITEDGMRVYKREEEMLAADNQGVKAVNLHSTTYLIIGANSRLENYVNNEGQARTACFWISGQGGV